MHGQIGEEDDEIVLDADDQTGITLVATVDDTNVVASLEVLSQFVRAERQRLLQ